MIHPSSGRKVLLVGWDAADWKIIQPLLDAGELPVLEKIVNGGVMGNLSSLRPMLSPMLWNSIATGKRPFQHGVHGFTEVDHELNQVVPVSSATRKCKAIWNILNDAGLKTHVIGWFATHPAEAIDGVCVSDRFASPAPAPGKDWLLPRGSVYPERLADSLGELRLRPEEIPGAVLKLFVRDAAKVNQENDKRLHQIAIHLAESFSVHAAATYALEHEPWDFAAVYYRAIDWLCHHFMEFYPPRLYGVYENDFERYKEVVNSAYRLHDQMLGRLLELAGEDATVLVVSDHGFKSDEHRPLQTPDVPAGIAIWHRMNGILAMRGAGLRRDELIHGANLLDITPTILGLFGLPVGADMDGRVLAEAFSDPIEISRIASWEKSESEQKSARTVIRRSPEEERALVRQFADIGYIDDPGDDPAEAIKSTERENRWALAQSYLNAPRFADALPLLESVYEEWPERRDFCAELALCQLNLGLFEEAAETLSGLSGEQETAGNFLLRANLEYRRGNLASSLDLLAQAEALDSASAGLQNQIGLTHLRLRNLKAAEAAFRKALACDAEDPHAHLGMAFCQLRAREFAAAAESALEALGLKFDLYLAHHHLGVALAHLGEEERAIQAFQTSLRYRPSWAPSHRYMALLFSRRADRANEAQRHRDFLKGRVARRAAAMDFQQKLRSEIAARARNRAAARKSLRDRVAPRPQRARTSQLEPSEFFIVSGLPRSGTSLMMQILEAAGLPIMRDDSRPADESNPRGYFEWAEIKRLPKDPFLIEQAHGRVTKVISMLLPSLPRRHRFRVIFMHREIEEVARSQEKLRARLAPGATSDRSAMATRLAAHRERIIELLRNSPNVDLLEIEYAELIDAPEKSLQRVIDFARLDTAARERMQAAIHPELRHFAGADAVRN